MNVLNPLLRITAKKQLKAGNFACFEITEGRFGYAVVFGEDQRMWVLDVYSENDVFCPKILPDDRLKWRISAAYARTSAWVLATGVKLSVYAESLFYVSWSRDLLGNGEFRPVLFGPMNTMRRATPKEVARFPQQYRSSDVGEFLQERWQELERINDKPGWTVVTVEQLARAKRPARPKPTGEHRIEVYVSSFEGTEISSRNDLEEDIQEEIGDDGFVSGGGSLVGPGEVEGGHVDIECSAEEVVAVLRKVRRVLHRLKAPPTTAIVNVTLLDDGTSKDKESLLGEAEQRT